MMKPMPWRFAMVCGVLAASCWATGARGEELSGLDDFVRQTMAAVGTPGVALAVTRGEELIVARGYGVREAGRADAVDQDTVFAIGSNSKYFTATALGLLVEEGRLSWDAPLTHYLPQLRFSNPYLTTELTLRDALSHRTGLERADMAWKVNSGGSRSEVLKQIEKLTPEIPFRSGYLYNNFMYVAAGEVIPAVTGTSWDAFVKARLLDPLGMSRTTTSTTQLAHVQNVARPHAVVNGHAKAIPYYNVDHVAPAGAINSSAADMAQWCKVQLGNGSLGGRQIIPKPVIDEVRKPQVLRRMSDKGLIGTVHAAYALGISRANFGPQHVLYLHDGSVDGMVSYLAFVPSAGVCTVVLTNGAPNYGLHAAIGTWILSRLLGLDTNDALTRFEDRVREEKAKEAGIAQWHARSHEPSVRATLAPSAYTGRYTHDLYGDVTITTTTGGDLWASWGRMPATRLQHHRADSFDLADAPALFDSTPLVLSFATDGSGEVESLLLERFGEKPLIVRFARKTAAR